SVTYDILRVRTGDSLLDQCCLDEEEDLSTARGHAGKSFLEMLIRLLEIPTYTSSTPELLQLTKLISTLCEPLEILAEVEENFAEDEMVQSGQDEAREIVGNYMWVRVPAVGLSRVALRCLCDALLNEACTKE
ncbi:unnamed protein product, partial [Symbiodinium microadriaticum]